MATGQGTWHLSVLNRHGTAISQRLGFVEEIVEHYDDDENGKHYIQFNAADVLDEGHQDLKGLKGKTVEAVIGLADGGQCAFTGKVIGLDREMGEVEIEGDAPTHTPPSP